MAKALAPCEPETTSRSLGANTRNEHNRRTNEYKERGSDKGAGETIPGDLGVSWRICLWRRLRSRWGQKYGHS